jgi:hypothetical protein
VQATSPAAALLAREPVSAEDWDAMELDERRTLLEAIIERVVVRPAKVRSRFDPGRVEVEWRFDQAEAAA